uniref:Uncharacterized protein n=1 Tax=Plectus sambesii TaxID=2011161 RepID=A0A914UJJ8_9BILA
MGAGAAKGLYTPPLTIQTRTTSACSRSGRSFSDRVDNFANLSRVRNIEIERELQRDLSERAHTLKLLLLGGSESGKSTIVKQMKYLHLSGFSESELLNFKFSVYNNVIEIVHQILDAAQLLQFSLPGDIQREIEEFLSNDTSIQLNTNAVSKLVRFRDTPEVQKIIKSCNEINLPDNAEYFMSRLEIMNEDGFVPMKEDIIRCRIITTGVHEIMFQYKSEKLKLIDVGGQKTQRRKWIHCFDDVTAILFVIALSCYDQQLAEDNTENRMEDSIKLFKEITSNKFLSRSSLILFLNKKDVFEKKIVQKPLKVCFPEYKGSNTYKEASSYIKRKVLKAQVDNGIKREVFPHFTNATDTRNIDRVFNSAIETVILKNLNKAGMT